MKKGDRIEGVIEEIRFPNRGVFHEGDTEVQVKNALPGQKVAVRVSKKRSHTAEAGLLEVLEKSPKELEPPCPQSGVCPPGSAGPCPGRGKGERDLAVCHKLVHRDPLKPKDLRLSKQDGVHLRR